ncbi:MAG: hypothetical protein F4Z28_06875 [Gammaproteobacteria bacterium]|nr:hypothetical protein [Gammaproteobacteria bacterium]
MVYEQMRRFFEFSGRTGTLAVALVAVAVLLLVVFPNLPVGGDMLDTKPGYAYQEAMASMEEYGADGRTTYALASMSLDTLFPLAYVTLFAGLIYRFRATEGTWWLAYIPVVAGLCDLLENVQITAMLVQYPDIGAVQVAWASAFTTVKWWIGSGYQILGVGLLLLAAGRAVFARIRGGDES